MIYIYVVAVIQHCNFSASNENIEFLLGLNDASSPSHM